jgi:aminopeptidase C
MSDGIHELSWQKSSYSVNVTGGIYRKDILFHDAFRCWLFATLLQLKVQIFVPLNKTIELVFLYLFFIVEYHLYFISRFTQKTPPEQRNLWLNEGIVLDPLRMGEILQG